jgi:hypothetical protein
MDSDFSYKKIFMVIFLMGILLLSIITWLTNSAIPSHENVKAAATSDSATLISPDSAVSVTTPAKPSVDEINSQLSRYDYYSSILGKATPLIFLILLIFGNVIFVRYSSGLYLMLALALFCTFTMIDYILLAEKYYNLKRTIYPGENGNSGLIGIVLVMLSVIAVMLNYAILKNWKKRQPLHASPDSHPKKPY